MKLGIVRGPKTYAPDTKRQHFRIGYLKEGVSVERVREHLLAQGFYDESVALPDPGQILSMRKLDDEHPIFQYHLRIFEDREVKGHYEYTPEDNFVGHMEEAVFEPRTEVYRGWVGSFLA